MKALTNQAHAVNDECSFKEKEKNPWSILNLFLLLLLLLYFFFLPDEV